MQLEISFRTLFYITELEKKNLFIWLFRRRYKKRVNKEWERIKNKYESGEIKKPAFDEYKKIFKK